MIDTQYSLAATQAAIPSEPIAPGAAGRSVGTPQAAAELAQAPATRADRVELNAPRQALDPVRMEAAGSELDSSVELLLILFRIAQKARELGVLQRDNENQAIIHAQKAQVDEMRSGATLMIAMAVIAGVGALASAVVGSLGALKNGKAISQEKTLQKNIDGRNELIDAKMQALGKTSDEDRKIVGKVWAADQAQDSVALRAAGRAFESRNGAPAGGQHGDPVLRPDGQRLGPGAPGRVAGERPGRGGQRHHRAEPEAEGRGPDELRYRLHEGRPAAHPAVHPEP